MKKILLTLSTLFCLILAITGCGNNISGNLGKSGKDLVGTWNGTGNALGKDKTYNSDGLCLTVEKDGTFTFSNSTNNITWLSGALHVKSDQITLDLGDETPATLPKGWETLASKPVLEYTMPSANTLTLEHGKITYFFRKVISSDKEEESESPLLTLAENDVWYSKEGKSNEDTTYALSLYDDYMELYKLDSKAVTSGEPHFLMNFFYLSDKDSVFTLYTYRNKKMDLPDFLLNMPEGYGKVELNINSSNDAITLAYNGKNLTFYNNVIYGLSTDTDSSHLTDTSFQWLYDSVNYFCHIKANPETGALYLYISDKEDSNAKTVRGEIRINEKKKVITYHFDKKASKKTAGKDSVLYQTFKKMDGKNIRYALIGNKLTLNLGKQTYSITLDEY